MTEKLDLSVIENVFAKKGFSPVPRVFEKPDPRGTEYGVFRAFVSDAGTRITVMKIGGCEPTDYTMQFAESQDFARWAADQT